MNAYWFKFLLYLDIFVGSLAARDPDVTISSYCGLALRSKGNVFLRGLGHVLNAISKDHCEKAITSDIARAKNAITRLGG
jgi:hypothetical protein